MTRALVLSLSLGVWLVTPAAAEPKLGEQAIVGEWWTEGRDGRIQFFKAKTGTYTGRLVWSKAPRNDTENPDSKLRSRSVVGIVLIWKLRYRDGAFTDGYVYNPEDGKTFRIEVTPLSSSTLRIRGYVGLSLFGQSQVWTRYR